MCAALSRRARSVERSRRARVFIESERRSLDNLLDELDEFIRKQDYRFADEKIGAEGDSWMRAIRMIAGGEGVF